MVRRVAFIENLKKSEIITDFDETIFNFYSEFETTIKAEE